MITIAEKFSSAERSADVVVGKAATYATVQSRRGFAWRGSPSVVEQKTAEAVAFEQAQAALDLTKRELRISVTRNVHTGGACKTTSIRLSGETAKPKFGHNADSGEPKWGDSQREGAAWEHAAKCPIAAPTPTGIAHWDGMPYATGYIRHSAECRMLENGEFTPWVFASAKVGPTI